MHVRKWDGQPDAGDHHVREIMIAVALFSLQMPLAAVVSHADQKTPKHDILLEKPLASFSSPS